MKYIDRHVTCIALGSGEADAQQTDRVRADSRVDSLDLVDVAVEMIVTLPVTDLEALDGD